MRNIGTLERIVVVPVNGYANRLQAWASASIMAAHFDASTQVCWETEDVAPAGAADIFAGDVIRDCFIDSSRVSDLLGKPHSQMPRYLTIDQDRGVVFLAGHDRGEQPLMPALMHALNASSGISTLVVAAGGKFHVPNEVDFKEKRRQFYANICWHSDIVSRLQATLMVEQPYIGLHIRQTDRSREAPTLRAIERALRTLSKRSGLTNVFIAADTSTARTEWTHRTAQLGLTPWTSDAVIFDRHDERSAPDAIVDWLLLGRASGLIYSAASSFGQEAAIMNARQDWTLPLEASPGLQTRRDLTRLAGSAWRRVGPRRD